MCRHASVRVYLSAASHQSPCWAAGSGSAAAPAEPPSRALFSRPGWTERSLCCQTGSRPAGTLGGPGPAPALPETDNEPDRWHQGGRSKYDRAEEKQRNKTYLRRRRRKLKHSESHHVQVPSGDSPDVFEQVVPGHHTLHVYMQLVPQRHDLLVQLLCPVHTQNIEHNMGVKIQR